MWRPVLAAFAVAGSFLASLVFYGTHENLVVLVIAWGLLLLAASLPNDEPRYEPLAGFVFALGTIVVLVVNYQWSLSKDTSFAPTFVIASLPVAYLVVNRLDERIAERLGIGLLAIGVLLGLISLVRYFGFGVRAHQPLIDPNSYASLNYLLWIPFVHAHVIRRWDVRPTPAHERALETFVSFTLVATVFATRSRTAGLIVAAALVFWLLVSLRRQLAVRGVLLHGLIAATAFLAVFVRSPPTPIDVAVESLGMGATVRLDLLRSAWAIFLDYPLTGVGLFCFGQMYGTYRLPTEQLTAGLFVHNDYLQFLAEGGPFLLVLPVTLLVFASRRIILGMVDNEIDIRRLGYVLAVGAACAHAFVNFVFFNFPLALLLGLLLGAATHGSAPRSSFLWRRRIVRGALVFGWVCTAYLLLDLVTAAVFQGQPGVPIAALRSDPQAQLRYARAAQALNGNRGVPVLAEAILLSRLGEQSGASVIYEQALTTFRRALRTDPWNTLGYVAMADFVRRNEPALSSVAANEPESLLLSAIAINPIEFGAIDRLLALHSERGRWGDAYLLLRKIVFPWVELMKRRDERATDRYLAELIRLAELAGENAFAKEVEAKRASLVGIKPPVREGWYF
jgi:O-antigen ligase